MSANGLGGFEPVTKPAERRALFDLQRRLRREERSKELPPGGTTGQVLTQDPGGDPQWADIPIDPRVAWGVVGHGGPMFTGDTVVAIGTVMTQQINVVTRTDRRYRLTFTAGASYGNGAIAFAVYSNGVYTTLDQWQSVVPATWTSTTQAYYLGAGGGTNRKYDVRIVTTQGAGPFHVFGSASVCLLLEDVGPV